MDKCERCGRFTDKLKQHGNLSIQSKDSRLLRWLCPLCSHEWERIFWTTIEGLPRERREKEWIKQFIIFMEGTTLDRVS